MAKSKDENGIGVNNIGVGIGPALDFVQGAANAAANVASGAVNGAVNTVVRAVSPLARRRADQDPEATTSPLKGSDGNDNLDSSVKSHRKDTKPKHRKKCNANICFLH